MVARPSELSFVGNLVGNLVENFLGPSWRSGYVKWGYGQRKLQFRHAFKNAGTVPGSGGRIGARPEPLQEPVGTDTNRWGPIPCRG
jgi:hypothetical protein